MGLAPRARVREHVAMANPVTCIDRRFDGIERWRREGDLVQASDEWLVVYFEDPPAAVDTSRPVAHVLGYYSESAPLRILVSFDDRGRASEYRCTAGLPVERDGRDLVFVGLDLEAVGQPGAEFVSLGEATFAIQRFVAGYPDDVVGLAQAGIKLAEALAAARAAPFDGSAEVLLGGVLASRRPS